MGFCLVQPHVLFGRNVIASRCADDIVSCGDLSPKNMVDVECVPNVMVGRAVGTVGRRFWRGLFEGKKVP